MHTPKKNSSRIVFVDGLRALAALYVVVHHTIIQLYDYNTVNTLSGFKKLSIVAFFQGTQAVDLFIVLSGYSLMLSVIHSGYKLKKGVFDFYKRRAIRILPPYYLSVLVSLLLIAVLIGKPTGTHWDVCLPVTTSGIVTHLLLIHDFFANDFARINHVLWSVAAEWRIYFLFPLLLWLWRQKGGGLTIFASVIISCVSFALLRLGTLYFKELTMVCAGVSPYIILFAFGMMAADISFSDKEQYRKLRRLPWLLLALTAFALSPLYKMFVLPRITWQSVFPYYILNIFFGLFAGCFLIACSKSWQTKTVAAPFVKALSWKPLVFTGTFSYSLYLIHAPLIQVISQYIVLPLHLDHYTATWLSVPISLLVSLAGAYLLYRASERPALQFLKNRKTTIPVFEATESPAP